MPKIKPLLCPYCKGTATFSDNHNLIKWGVNCIYGSSTIIRNFDTQEQAQQSIDEWCFGDGRLACRLFLLGQTKCSDYYTSNDELLKMFTKMEETTVAKTKFSGDSADAEVTTVRIIELNEQTCPYYVGTRSKKGGGYLVQCVCPNSAPAEFICSSDGSYIEKMNYCSGDKRTECRPYLYNFLKEHDVEVSSDTNGNELKNMYTGFMMKLEGVEQTALNPIETTPAPPQPPLEDAPALPRTITDVTAEIRFYKAQTVAHIIEIGKRLIEAKAMLEHGQWGEWLKNEVDFSQDTAGRFMKLASEYSNSATLRNLSYSNLIALLAVPAAVRDDFIEATHVVDGEEKTVDEMSTRELQRVIKERDDAIKQAEQATSLKERISENYAKLEKVSIEHSQKSINLSSKNQELEEDNQRLQAKVKKLESLPIDVAVEQPSDAEMASMRTAIRAEVIKELALPDTYLAKKGVEEATSLFIDSVSGSVSNGLVLAMRLDERSAAKMMEAYISTLVQYTQELRDRLNLMKAVDRNVKDGAGDVDW